MLQNGTREEMGSTTIHSCFRNLRWLQRKEIPSGPQLWFSRCSLSPPPPPSSPARPGQTGCLSVPADRTRRDSKEPVTTSLKWAVVQDLTRTHSHLTAATEITMMRNQEASKPAVEPAKHSFLSPYTRRGRSPAMGRHWATGCLSFIRANGSPLLPSAEKQAIRQASRVPQCAWNQLASPWSVSSDQLVKKVCCYTSLEIYGSRRWVRSLLIAAETNTDDQRQVL